MSVLDQATAIAVVLCAVIGVAVVASVIVTLFGTDPSAWITFDDGGDDDE